MIWAATPVTVNCDSLSWEAAIATCFVAGDLQTQDIAGFYTLTATSVALDALSPELVRKLPRYPVVPAAPLGRLAVAASAQGKGLGAALLADALLRVARVEMRVYAMWGDAKDAAAQRFYEKQGLTLLAGEARRWYCRSQQIVSDSPAHLWMFTQAMGIGSPASQQLWYQSGQHPIEIRQNQQRRLTVRATPPDA